MAIKKNIIANYFGQIYSALVVMVMVPVYVRYLGVESYGLIGFFSMLQAWFLLLDMGMSPTFSRQVSRFRAGVISITELRQLLRILEIIFITIAIIGSGALVFFSHEIASSWLKVEHLNHNEVNLCIVYMAIIIGSKWISGLFSGAINGFEKQVWLSLESVLINTIKFIGVILVFQIYGATISNFFLFQVIVTLLDLFLLGTKTYLLLPAADGDMKWSFAPLREVINFSLSIAVNAIAWAFVTQSDKLILSKMLSLSDYAYFSMAIVLANGISILTTPIGTAILPRLTKLEAENKQDELIVLYRKATRAVTVMAASSSLVLMYFSEQILFLWTKDRDVAAHSGEILKYYSFANGLLAIAVFPYYLQFAKGNLKLHMIGNISFSAILFPLIIYCVEHFGAVGAGYAWLVRNIVYFIFWIPLVHSRFAPNLNKVWFKSDIFPIYFAAFCISFVCYLIVPKFDNRFLEGLELFLICGITLLSCLVFSFRSTSRDKFNFRDLLSIK